MDYPRQLCQQICNIINVLEETVFHRHFGSTLTLLNKRSTIAPLWLRSSSQSLWQQNDNLSLWPAELMIWIQPTTHTVSCPNAENNNIYFRFAPGWEFGSIFEGTAESLEDAKSLYLVLVKQIKGRCIQLCAPDCDQNVSLLFHGRLIWVNSSFRFYCPHYLNRHPPSSHKCCTAEVYIFSDGASVVTI